MNKFSNYVKNIKTKIQERIWLYSFIKAFVKVAKPIVNFIAVFVIIASIYDLIQMGSILGTIILGTYIGLGILIFVMIWLNYYFDLREKRNTENLQKHKAWQKEMLRQHVNNCVEAYFKDTEHTQQEKEDLRQELLKSAGLQ